MDSYLTAYSQTAVSEVPLAGATLFEDTPLVTHFELLNPDIHVWILKLIIKRSSIEDLTSLITAFPETLARHILIITDSRKNPYQLFKVPKCASIYVLDFFNHPWHELRSIPVRILSFSELEEKAVTSQLLFDTSSGCPYARFMTPETPLLIQTYGEESIAYKMIMPLVSLCGVTLCIHFNKRNNKGVWNRVDASKQLMGETIQHGASYEPSTRIVDIISPKVLSSQAQLPNVETLRLTLSSECRSSKSMCLPKLIDISSFTGVKNLYVSFEDIFGPDITFPPHLKKKVAHPSKKGESFHYINKNWSFNNPYGRDSCEHMPPLVSTCQAQSMRPLYTNGVGKSFKFLNLVGIPDWELTRLLTDCEELHWKRLCHSQRLNGRFKSIGDYELIVAPKLIRLTVFNEVHLGAEYKHGMNPFCAPNVQVLALVALQGSTSTWDLRLIFHRVLDDIKGLNMVSVKKGGQLSRMEEGMFQAPVKLKVLHLCSLAVSSTERPPMGLSISGLVTARSSLEELHIMGYVPVFCMKLATTDMKMVDDGIVFERLHYIRIDISSVPRLNKNVFLYFLETRFPVLRTLCLDLFNEGNISGKCPGSTKIQVIQVPSCLQTICINTLIHSQISIMGRPLLLPRVSVEQGMFTIWKSNGVVFQFCGTHVEKPYREWVYSQ